MHIYVLNSGNQSKSEAICGRKDDLFIYIYMPPISHKYDSGWHTIKLQKQSL